MKIKIKSDGDALNTKVTTEDGIPIENVTDVKIHIPVTGPSSMVITVAMPEVEINGDYTKMTEKVYKHENERDRMSTNSSAIKKALQKARARLTKDQAKKIIQGK